jgi:hypothetical protein
VTESEWLGCNDPTMMLEFLRGKVSDRKLRLFACACCRRIWRLFNDERSRHAVEVSERYADGQATIDELADAGERAIRATWTVRDEHLPASPVEGVLQAAEAAEMSSYPLPGGLVWGANGGYGAWEAAWGAAAAVEVVGDVREREQGHQVALLRCIIGSPFDPVALNSTWLTPTVSSLAAAAYEERSLPSGQLDPARLAVLADSLEDAGCEDAEILKHLRGCGPHVRGCWVIDCLLEKK